MLLPMAIALSGLDPRLLHTVQLFTSGVVLLLLWRFWKFKILPFLKPDEPKRLPYWIPSKHP